MTNSVTKSVSRSVRTNTKSDGKIETGINNIINSLDPEILKGGEKRTRIIESAIRGFERYGYKKTTVEEIARDALIAKGTVYIYFRDKEDIIVSIIREKIAKVFREVSAAIGKEKDVPSKILRAIGIVIEYHRNDEAVNRVISRDSAFFGPIIFREILQFEVFLIEFFSIFLTAGIEEGSIRADIDVKAAARMMIRFNQANVFRIKTGEAVDVDEYMELFRKIVFEGIGKKRKKR